MRNKSFQKMNNINHQNIILGGDFNFPGWNWKENVLKAKCNYPSLHYRFRDILDNHHLKQIVTEPTREENVLDLLITNNPTKIKTHSHSRYL